MDYQHIVNRALNAVGMTIEQCDAVYVMVDQHGQVRLINIIPTKK